jgi:prepilin-type N-terminal cleavage/methylation domain-containing protein
MFKNNAYRSNHGNIGIEIALLLVLTSGILLGMHIARLMLSSDTGALSQTTGFTLIELSIVLVIIGLVIGGIVAGKDMLENAKVRKQLTQIEQYNTALRVFQNKYGQLPGDLTAVQASSFGFNTRNYTNMLVGTPMSVPVAANDGSIHLTLHGEGALAWSDLSDTGLINESLNSDGATFVSEEDGNVDGVLPKGILGGRVIFSAGRAPNAADWDACYTQELSNNTFIAVSSAVQSDYPLTPKYMPLSSAQAYQMDIKLDDGKPLTGNVTAQGTGYYLVGAWAYSLSNGLSACGSGYNQNIPNNPVTSCYHNNNSSSNPMIYASGDAKTCAISIKAQ